MTARPPLLATLAPLTVKRRHCGQAAGCLWAMVTVASSRRGRGNSRTGPRISDGQQPRRKRPTVARSPTTTKSKSTLRRPSTERTDAGGRTVDTWTLRRPHRTPVTWTGPVEHRTLAPDTGHRMPDTNADTVTTAQPASGPPCHHAERPHAKTPNHACALALPAGCSAAPPAKPRLGALLSSDQMGGD
jgi:hypothetical protein